MYRSSRSSCLIQQYHVFLAFQCKVFLCLVLGWVFFCQCSDNKAQLQTLNSFYFCVIYSVISRWTYINKTTPILQSYTQASLSKERKKNVSNYSIQVASPLGYYNSYWRTETKERTCFQECLVSICIYPVNCHLFSYSQKSG